MDLFKILSIKTKIATICFVLGKMTFVPSVCYLFLGESKKALIAIIVYISLIAVSIILSLMSMRDKKIDTSLLTKRIVNDKEHEATYTVKIKDGKVVSII